MGAALGAEPDGDIIEAQHPLEYLVSCGKRSRLKAGVNGQKPIGALALSDFS